MDKEIALISQLFRYTAILRYPQKTENSIVDSVKILIT